MRRNSFFWGILIVLIGVLFLLDNLGILPVNAWQLFWPAALIFAGLWFLFGRLLFRQSIETETVSIPLEGARQAEIKVYHGAGKILVGAQTSATELLSGTFTGGVKQQVSRSGDTARVSLSANTDNLFVGPFAWNNTGFVFDFQINRDVNATLDIETGASENRLDLTDLHVSSVRIQTGASSTVVRLPANAGTTSVIIKAGAASVDVFVPTGVAARIRNQSGLSGNNFDTSRFTQVSSGHYESPDFATAVNKADISIESGVGSVNVK